MATLMSLPSEVIDIILSYNDISFEDIINLRCVCKQFRYAAKTTDYCFQKKKFFQRWPSAKRYYNKLHKENEQKKFQENEQKNKKHVDFIETSISCVKQLRNYIPQIMVILKYFDDPHARAYHERSLYKDLQKIKKLEAENYTEILFLIDEMEHLLTQPLRAGDDLREGNCYIKLYDFLKIHHRKYILKRYIKEKSHHKELLEESATILAQQLQLGKDIFYSSVKASLNTIALQALNFLREKHPNHSIFTTPDKYFSHWENSNIDDNYWSEEEGTQIMNTLEEYMFDKLNFRSINTRELDYMCIDYVLKNKCGQNLILFIIYESVARRLGLRCDIVSDFDYASLYNISLFWVPRYNFAADYGRNISNLIDRSSMRCYGRIKFDEFPECIMKCFYEGIFKRTFGKMLDIILCRWFEECSYNFIHGDIKRMCSGIPYIDRFFKPRPPNIKFAVGMIVTHGDKSTDCSKGVIIGWYQYRFNDIFNCKELRNLAENITPLKICGKFTATGKRIYYRILTKNAKLCFVEEDAITLTKPNWIENKNIYRYFCKFEGTHYVPNEMLAEIYYEDAAITARTIFKN